MTSVVELEMKRQHISFLGRQFLEHSVVTAGSGEPGRWGRGEYRRHCSIGCGSLRALLCRWRPLLAQKLCAGPEGYSGREALGPAVPLPTVILSHAC